MTPLELEIAAYRDALSKIRALSAFQEKNTPLRDIADIVDTALHPAESSVWEARWGALQDVLGTAENAVKYWLQDGRQLGAIAEELVRTVTLAATLEGHEETLAIIAKRKRS